jgi:iduronate 2-sulfatase
MDKILPIIIALCAFMQSNGLQAQQPNVLFIAVDDLRTALGCYGDPLVQSPNIDRLAIQGRIYHRAYCMQAVCGPSRTSLLTGRLPDNTRVWHNRNLFRDVQPDLVTLPQHFMNHGYHTVSLGKVFSGNAQELDPVSWSEPEILKQSGWRNYVRPGAGESGKGAAWEDADVDDEGYTDGKLARLAIEKLSSLKAKNKPFFLAVGFFKPHLPFNAPRRYWDLYDASIFDVRDDGMQVQDVSIHAHHSHRELGGYRDIPRDEHLDAATTRKLRHGYYACVSYIDAQIGKLLDELGRLGLAENTIVVLWGDHGFSLGEKNRWCKGTNFERDTRVPLIISAPQLQYPGAGTQALVETVDLYPTLALLAGLPLPNELDGTSLMPSLKDPQAAGREAVLSQFARPFKKSVPEFMGYSLRTDTHRYTRWISWADRKTVAEELYDYGDNDCAQYVSSYLIEQRNIADSPSQAETKKQLSDQLDQVLQQRVKSLPPPSAGINLPQPPRKKKKS